MSRMFHELIQRSKRITRDEFASNFGYIADDVAEMLDSEQAREVTRLAREEMESAPPLENGVLRLQQLQWGLFSTAPELERGQVAAVDGTPTLPMQMYSVGQALCVAVASLSHRRALQDSLHFWSSKAFLEDAKNADDHIARQEKGLFGISQTAYMRYYELNHALEIKEPLVFFDGTLIYEWLATISDGVEKYDELFKSGKKCLGVMKSIKANALFSRFARALKTGEVFIVQNLAQHLSESNAPNKNVGETSRRYVLPDFERNVAPHIWRGLFKPGKKAFGFEAHEDHLEDMLRILSADCQMNNIGHEIPYLLNRVDEEVRRNFNSRILQDRIAAHFATQSEELFFEEAEERSFR